MCVFYGDTSSVLSGTVIVTNMASITCHPTANSLISHLSPIKGHSKDMCCVTAGSSQISVENKYTFSKSQEKYCGGGEMYQTKFFCLYNRGEK